MVTVDSIQLIQDSLPVPVDSIRILNTQAYIYAKLKESKVKVITDSLSIKDLNQSYSADGLIVAKAPTYPGPRRIDICRRQSTLLSVELQKN